MPNIQEVYHYLSENILYQALEAPAVYVFGELLDMPNIQENCLLCIAYWRYMFLLVNMPYKENSIATEKKVQ